MRQIKREKIRKIYTTFFILLALFAQGVCVLAAPSEKTNEAIRNVITDPNGETVSLYVKMMLKEYKKASKNRNYEEALDYLRGALYFLKQDPSSELYKDTYQKFKTLIEKTEFDTSQSNRLEVAKNLYLEGKYFPSAYEFSILLKEGYEIDLCYEYLGDIAKNINSESVAFAFYKKAVEINPDNLNVKYKYANALLKQGKANDAIYYFEDVIEGTNSQGIINEIINTFVDRLNNNPNDENNYEILGLAYQKLGEYNKTYQLLRKSLLINPNDIFLRYYLGNLLFNIREFSFADEIYTEILEENPYESQIRISRAKTYVELNQLEKAIKDYQVVLAMYPDSLQAQYGLYTVLKDRISLDKIINLFYPLEPDYKLNDEGYINLGYFANKMGNSLDASVFFEKALTLNDKSEVPYIELYRIYQLLGLNSKAKNIIIRGYKMFPNNSEISSMYSAVNSEKIDEKNDVALSYLNEGEYEKAITVYQQIEPKTWETYEAIGSCYRQLGDFKNAVSYYKKSAEMNPENTEIYYALGVTYLEANNIDKAKEAFKTSVRKDDRNVKSKKMLAFIEQKEAGQSIEAAYEYYEKGDYASALRYLNNAAQTFPNDAKVFFYRGLTKEALDDTKGAVADFKETIKLNRNYIEAYFRLAEGLDRLNKKREALYMYEKYLGAETINPEYAKRAEQKVLELGEKYY